MNKPSSMHLPQFINSLEDRQAISSQSDEEPTALPWTDAISDVEGVYIHVPFCFHKCHYCDFFSIAGADDRHESFVDRLIEEIKFVGSRMSKPLKSIFIGGGTPTLLEPELFERLAVSIRKALPMATEYEWTVEANPETVTNELAQVMAAQGVNRVSIGAQSFDAELLKTLERWHDPDNVDRAISCFRTAGIHNYNLDLIYSIPKQTISQVQRDLQQAIDLKPVHISCYALIYEPNTPLRARLDRGEIERVDHDVEAEMFELVRETLTGESYVHYEISNFAKPGFQCRHNLMYWKNKSWWPLGPAAAGHLDGRRWRNVPRLSDYIRVTPMPIIEDVEFLNDDRRAGEAFMLGLRLMEGMDRDWVDSLVDKSFNQWRLPVINRFLKEKKLQWKNDQLALTESGILIADTVISALLMRDSTITDT